MAPLWQLDQDLFRAINVGLRHPWLDPVIVALTYSGLGYIQAMALVVSLVREKFKDLAAVGLLTGFATACAVFEHNLLAGFGCLVIVALMYSLRVRTALVSGLAIVVSGLVRVVLAELINRQRPSNFSFAIPIEHVYGHPSYPSGHTTTSFAVFAVVLWHSLPFGARLPILCLVWAALVGFSRVYVGVHYPLDALGGGALGFGIGSVVAYFLPRQVAGTVPSTEQR